MKNKPPCSEILKIESLDPKILEDRNFEALLYLKNNNFSWKNKLSEGSWKNKLSEGY